MTRVPAIQLRTRVGEPGSFKARLLTEHDANIIAAGDVDVFKPDGSPLIMLRRRAIPVELNEAAYPALHSLRSQKTDNRGIYSGASRSQETYADGTVSSNTRTRDENGKIISISSAVVGFFDRQGGRFPYCRQTAFTAQKVAQWKTIVPLAQAVSGLFERTAPFRYMVQKNECARCPQEYVISGTPFTTLTVNNNVAPSAAHLDKGDCKEGLGAISVVRRGHYEGALLVFPEYSVGVDLQDGDVVFFNSHEWHGVTPMTNTDESAERISVVYYMRKKMTECLPPHLELARAQGRGAVIEDDE